MRYFLELSYHGKFYHGWQNQPNAITVQEVLEKALSTLLKEPIAIVGAGRTDAGVHARQMYAHFETETQIDPDDLKFRLNSFLADDIAIRDIFKVTTKAHARFDAISRAYLYRIARYKNVFAMDQSYLVQNELDIDNMNEASKILFQYNDFQCFSKSNTDVKTYNCKIMKAEWRPDNDELHFEIKADRFLRNMVRAIVGTMINIGLGKMKVDDMHDIIQSKNRSEAGFSVPAHALFLTEIIYPKDIRL